jgi:hypothetical protein
MEAHAGSAYVRVSSKTEDYATQRSAIERWDAERKSAKTTARAEL